MYPVQHDITLGRISIPDHDFMGEPQFPMQNIFLLQPNLLFRGKSGEFLESWMLHGLPELA